jgi:hypothetical protein
MITKYTNIELTSKIKNLLNDGFTKCNILNSFTSKTIALECNWNGMEYVTIVYLEKINNPKYEYIITVGTDSFPYSAEGLNQAVDYINN